MNIVTTAKATSGEHKAPDPSVGVTQYSPSPMELEAKCLQENSTFGARVSANFSGCHSVAEPSNSIGDDRLGGTKGIEVIDINR